MLKRRGATPENVDAWIRHGDGQGEGINFRPFFQVRDVPSRGRSHIVVGLRTGRTHHYMSDIEYSYHLLAEYSPEVLDIREQFALLPREDTQEIATDLRIRHPVCRIPALALTAAIAVATKLNFVLWSISSSLEQMTYGSFRAATRPRNHPGRMALVADSYG